MMRCSIASICALVLLSAEMFKAMAGVDIVRIAYKSGASQISDLISGQVQLTFGTVGTVAPHIKSGRLTALAVTSAEPTALKSLAGESNQKRRHTCGLIGLIEDAIVCKCSSGRSHVTSEFVVTICYDALRAA